MAGNEIKAQLVKDISTAISDGVDKVTPTVQEGIHQYSMLGLAKGIEGLVMLITLSVLIKVSIKWGNNLLKEEEISSDYDMERGITFVVVLTVILGFLGVLVGAHMLISGINQFIAPLPTLMQQLH
jgi:hypothetical protein